MRTYKELDIKYYDVNGVVHTRCIVPVTESALIHFELMQSHYCKLSFKLGKAVYFKLGDFIETDYGRFELVDGVKPKDDGSLGYSYDLQMEAYYRKWKNKRMKYMPNSGSPEGTFTLTSSISTHANVVIDNLKFLASLGKSYLYDPKYEGEGTDYVFKVDESVDLVKAKTITYSNSSILDAISNIAQTFECEWWLEGNIIHFGTCENTNAIVYFKDGENIVSMSSSQSQSSYANRVYAFGAARNLPSGYKQNESADVTKNGVVERRLMLPTIEECSDKNKSLLEENGFELKDGYIQVRGLIEDEYVEGVTTNDDIYPRNLIKTSNVTSYERDVEDESTPESGDFVKRTFYKVGNLSIIGDDGEKTGDMAFRSSYILSGKTLHIVFQSGSLNGMDFECQFNPDAKQEILRGNDGNPILKDGKEQVNPESQVFEVVGNEDYGRFLPDTDLHPKDGDTFVLYNWDSTKLGNTLVTSSANELLTDSIKNLKKSMIDPTTYTCTASSGYTYNDGNGMFHQEGDRVSLFNKGYGGNPRASRVIGYELHLDIPFDGVKYIVGEKPAYSRLNAMSSQIEELIFNGQSYIGKGGGGNTIYIIKSYDSVLPTEYNVYSARAIDNQRLSKVKDDIANGFITFVEGIAIGAKKAYNIFKDGIAHLFSLHLDGDLEVYGSTQLGTNGTSTSFGDFHADSTGARISVSDDGTSTAEFDFINIRRAAQFREITIKELKHIGGELAITAAAMVCSKVEKVSNGFKCYFDTSDSDGEKKVFQQFIVGDQARCQQFGDLDAESGKPFSTRYYWRLVVEVGDDYIVLSDSDKDKGSTSEPQSGDNIVQLGYRYADNPYRQSAIILSATALDSPSTKYYQGINDYSLNHVVKDEGFDTARGAFHSNVYGDSYVGDKDGNGYFSYDATTKQATFRGTAIFESGIDIPKDSTIGGETRIEDITTRKDLENLNIRSGNLLRNTSFLGDYESNDVSEDMDISDDTKMFSPNLKYWVVTGAVSVTSKDGIGNDGMAEIFPGALRQELSQPLLDGEPYTLSFYANGTALTIIIGSMSFTQELTAEEKRYELHFTNDGKDNDFVAIKSDNAIISDIMLTYGTIAPAWSPAYVDNDKSVAQFQNVKYLLDAIAEGSTTIDGGLVISQQIRVGNYRNKRMVRETGGMSGYYNDDNSPYLWGGGSLEQAIRTIRYYKDDPTRQPSEEELRDMANFVVTHGGRAILNDIVLRGFVYAEGGVMKSVRSPNGNFQLDEFGNAKLRGEVNATSGTIGGFTLSPSLFYSGSDNNDDWNAELKKNLIQFGINFLRLAQTSSYNDKIVAYQKVGIGKGSDPNYNGNETDCNSALYIYRQMMNVNHPYYPAAQVISDNVSNRNVALRAKGAVQVHGGLVESGYVFDYGNNTKANIIDISRGTTILVKNDATERHIFLPSLSEVRTQGGFSKDDYFCVPITVFADRNSSSYIYVSTQSTEFTENPVDDCGEICNNDGEGGHSNYGKGNSVRLGAGDCWRFALVNSSSGYYIQVLTYGN